MKLDRSTKLAGCLLFGSTFALLACLTVGKAKPRDARTVPRDTPTATAPRAPELSDLERNTVDAINEIRAKSGLRRLAVSAELTGIARAHSAYQARTGRSGHVGAGGSTLVDRALQNGVEYHMIAENVAMNSGYADPVGSAVSSWMKSRGHRENILNPVFTHTGVGVVAGAGGTYFTQMFLVPR